MCGRARLTGGWCRFDCGFHGPDEGALHSHSWREDRAPLVALVDRYREQGQRKSTTTAARRSAAETELLGSLSPLRRIVARQTLRLADRAIPRREITKTAFLQAIDAARHAARTLGQHLHSAGHLVEATDIFHLTITEAISAPLAVDPTVIAARAAQRQEYLKVQIPTSFVGVPVPSAVAPSASSATGDSALLGTGASAGTVPAWPASLPAPTMHGNWSQARSWSARRPTRPGFPF